MKNVLKILEKPLYAFFVLAAILLVWSLLPVKNGPKILAVLSGSMEPAIHTGSVVIVKPTAQYEINDIVTFGKDTRTEVPTTHRIVDSRAQDGEMLFITKGDANEDNDAREVSGSEILGKVVFHIPYLGYILDFVKKPVGFAIVIILPAFYVAYDEVKKITAEIKKMRKTKEEASRQKSNDV